MVAAGAVATFHSPTPFVGSSRTQAKMDKIKYNNKINSNKRQNITYTKYGK
jgi:hypothetical protein